MSNRCDLLMEKKTDVVYKCIRRGVSNRSGIVYDTILKDLL